MTKVNARTLFGYIEDQCNLRNVVIFSPEPGELVALDQAREQWKLDLPYRVSAVESMLTPSAEDVPTPDTGDDDLAPDGYFSKLEQSLSKLPISTEPDGDDPEPFV